MILYDKSMSFFGNRCAIAIVFLFLHLASVIRRTGKVCCPRPV